MLLGRSPCFFKRCSTSSAIAWIWRGLAPLQITKKSAKEVMSRRSRMWIAFACLSSAARAAVSQRGSGSCNFFARGSGSDLLLVSYYFFVSVAAAGGDAGEVGAGIGITLALRILSSIGKFLSE